MIHGGLGLIDDYTPGQHTMFLPTGLLNPLTVANKTFLYGIYYPSKEDSSKHGFVFSPIPDHYWPCVGRYIIRLKHDEPGIKEISNYLSETSSILFSEATRSAYSFDTWNLTVGLDLPAGSLGTEASSAAGSTRNSDEAQKHFRQLKAAIQNDFAKYLYTKEEECDPVQLIQHTALAYFHNQLRPEPLYKPFPVVYESSYGSLSGPEFTYVVEAMLCASEKPHIVFAAADGREMTIRVQVIPGDRRKRFFTARYDYKSTTRSTKGILASVLREFPEEYVIWEMTNHTLQSFSIGEDGTTLLLIEDTSTQREKPAIAAQELFNRITLPGKARLLDIQAREVTAVTIADRIHELRQQGKAKNDVFLSYCHEDEHYAEMIREELYQNQQRVYMARRELEAGDRFLETIMRLIGDSREMCILVTPSITRSSWVMMEYGIALAYGKHIAPLTTCSKEEVPPVFRNVQHLVDFSDLGSYIKGVLKRKRHHHKMDLGMEL